MTHTMVKSALAGIASLVCMSFGVILLPVALLIIAMLIDFYTGIQAAEPRGDAVESKKSAKGIVKKVCLLLLVAVGLILDVTIGYAVNTLPISFTFPLSFAAIIAVWLIINELISILENMIDIGVELPPFLPKILKNIKGKVEAQAPAAAALEQKYDKEGE